MRALRYGCSMVIGGALLGAVGCTQQHTKMAANTPVHGTLNGALVTVGGPAPGARPVDGEVSASNGSTTVATARVTGNSLTLTLPAGT